MGCFRLKPVGEKIKFIREYKNITKKDIYNELGISEETLRRIEGGKNHPRVSTLLPLCDFLDINVGELFIGEYSNDFDYFKSARTYINYLINNTYIKDAKDLINSLDKFPSTSDDIEQEYYASKYYYQGILTLRESKNNHKSKQYFQSALDCIYPNYKIEDYESYRYNEFSMKVMLALAINIGGLGDRETYRLILIDLVEKLESNNNQWFLYYYSLAACLYREEKYKEALLVCDKAIENVMNVNKIFYLNMIYYVKGMIYLEMENIEESHTNFQHCLSLSQITCKKEFVDLLSNKIENKLLTKI